MKNKKLLGEFGRLHFIRRKRKNKAYDYATLVKVELEQVIEPFKNDLVFTGETLMKNFELENEIGTLKIKLKDKDKQISKMDLGYRKQIEVLKAQLEDALKSNEEYKVNQEKLNQYLDKVVDIVKATNEAMISKPLKVTKINSGTIPKGQTIGVKSGARTSAIIKKVKEI